MIKKPTRKTTKLTLASITSYDLEDYADLDAPVGGVTKREKAVYKLLKGKAIVGDFFDWKEEDEMLSYIRKHLRKHPLYKYAYNAYPGGDGTSLVFSKVKLPKAEEV